MAGKISGPALGAITAGFVFGYASLKGKSITASIQAVVAGKSPSTAASANTIGGTPSSPGSSGSSSPAPAGGNASGGSDAANEALGKMMAAAYGWSTGAQWTALNNIVMAESGWSDTVTNPSSGAAGIAQNISGFSAGYQSGNASQQIAWLLSYIKQRYGTPTAAWAFHLANNWY